MYTRSKAEPGFHVLWKDDVDPAAIAAFTVHLAKWGIRNPRISIHKVPGEQAVTLWTRGGSRTQVPAEIAGTVLGSPWSWICEMGRQTLVVEGGKVWSSECTRAKPLGSTTDFELPNAPSRCTVNSCNSAFDALAEKRRAQNLELPFFMQYTVPPGLQQQVQGLRAAILERALVEQQGFTTGESRQNYPGSPFKTTNSVLLHAQCDLKPYNRRMKINGVLEDLQCGPTPELQRYPQVQEFLGILPRILGHGVEALGQVILSKLPAGESISTHWDAGYYFEWYNRYHFVLQTHEDCDFVIGSTLKNMKEGEIWRINNLVSHSVDNRSPVDRYHLVVDLRPGSGAPT